MVHVNIYLCFDGDLAYVSITIYDSQPSKQTRHSANVYTKVVVSIYVTLATYSFNSSKFSLTFPSMLEHKIIVKFLK